MKIETERLYIFPLDIRQLELWANNIEQLVEELNCIYKGELIKGIFKEIIKGQIELAKEDEENYYWYGFWLIIRKTDNTIIGSITFKNKPNENGEVEIGYGLGEDFEKQGYMTESVKNICNWALKQDGVDYIISETDLGNIPSENILKDVVLSNIEEMNPLGGDYNKYLL